MTEQYTIRFVDDSGASIAAAHALADTNLLELARAHNIAIDAPCGGNGTCGKCRVRIREHEADHVADWQLACCCTITSDLTVEVPTLATDWQFGLKPEAAVEDDALWQELCELLAGEGVAVGETVCDRGTEGDRGTVCDKGTEGDRETVLLSPFALAIDVGTTSVSVVLIDPTTGTMIAKASGGNAQIRYGADVITRIIAQERPDGVALLKQAIIADTLNPLIARVCLQAQLVPSAIRSVVIAGNTTMEHLLMGVEATPIRMEPFEPPFLVFPESTAGAVGLALAEDTPVYLAPNVGSYVGGDITAGVLASGMWTNDELRLFVDLGTNGELVFGNRDFLVTCACSAGPAFEGGEIGNGMRAVEGAIEAATIDEETGIPRISVIGG